MNRQRKEEIKHAIEFLTSCQGQEDINEILQCVCTQHRTHQQSLGRIIYQVLLCWSKDAASHDYDLRNEETVKFAADAIIAVGDRFFPFI